MQSQIIASRGGGLQVARPPFENQTPTLIDWLMPGGKRECATVTTYQLWISQQPEWDFVCHKTEGENLLSRFGFGQVNTQLFELAIQMRAFQPSFFSNTRHAAVFLPQMIFKIETFKFITRFTQGQFQRN